MDSLPESNIPTKAFVVEKPGGPFVLQDVVLDSLRPNELLIEIKYSGICHTDLVVQSGHMPLGSFPTVLGHEGAGVIRRLGAGLRDSDLEVGDRVLLSYSSCLDCSACREGRKGACDNIAMTNFVGTREDGQSAIRYPDGGEIRGSFFGQSSFSKLAVVDARSVVKYHGPVDDLAFLAPLGCGYMTGAATVLNVLKPKPGNTIAIFGLGAVGLCALMAAKDQNLREIIAFDLLDSRLEVASSLGATKTMPSKKYETVEAAIREALPQGVDFILDTTGVTSIIDSGMRALAHGGTLAIVGTPRPGHMLSIEAMDMLVHCKSLIGVTGGYCDPQQFIPRLIEMFKSGSFAIDKLHKVYPLDKIEDAVEDMKLGKTIKPVLAW